MEVGGGGTENNGKENDAAPCRVRIRHGGWWRGEDTCVVHGQTHGECVCASSGTHLYSGREDSHLVPFKKTRPIRKWVRKIIGTDLLGTGVMSLHPSTTTFDDHLDKLHPVLNCLKDNYL